MKGSIELSANFLVMIIISIVVFGLGLILAKQILTGSTDITEKSFAQLDKGVGELACLTGERICISIQQQTILKKEFKQFAIAIENVLQQPADRQKDTFKVSITQAKAVDKEEQPISSQLEWLPHVREDLIIPRQQTRTMGVGVQVPPDAEAGNYVFDIVVEYHDGMAWQPYHPGRSYKFYVHVP